MATYTFPCEHGDGYCTYDSGSEQSLVVAVDGHLSVVSSEVAHGFIEQSVNAGTESQSQAAEKEALTRGQSVRLPMGMSYDGLIALLQEPANMTDEDKSRLQAATTQLAVHGDGVYVTCTCTHVWVVPINAEPVH
jgi:hypothetical protein